MVLATKPNLVHTHIIYSIILILLWVIDIIKKYKFIYIHTFVLVDIAY
jgi:hypothetical protein